MSVGVYGINRASDVSVDDIDIFYNYTSDVTVENLETFRLEPSEVLSEIELPENEQEDNRDNLLEGLYNLTLPATIFNQTGIYTIYIKPKTIFNEIVECGVLGSLPNVRGIVIDKNSVPENLRGNNALQGYKIEYYDVDTNEKIRNVVRHVVTSNRVVPITDNNSSTTQKSIRYRFDDVGSLIFLQLTPSSASNLKPNQIPFLGDSGQKIAITNTFFEPICLEVTMTDTDLNSVVDIVAGEQLKDVDNGILTHFNRDREIVSQFDLYKVEDRENGITLHEVKQRRENIDSSQDIQDIIDNTIE
ncbi:MAG: hypothetical protein ACOC2W_04415 [bacterium]